MYNFTGLVVRVPELIGIVMLLKWSWMISHRFYHIRSRGESVAAAIWLYVKQHFTAKKAAIGLIIWALAIMIFYYFMR